MSFIPVFDAISPIITKILDFIPDPTQKAAQLNAIIAACEQWDNQQVQIDTEEAKNENIFVSGARPFILWICGFAFAYKFIIQPFLIFSLIAFGSKLDYHMLPTLDWTEMSSVLMGMLGLGGMRTMEKLQSNK